MAGIANPRVYASAQYVLKTNGATINIQTSDPLGKGRPSRAIVVGTSGTLVVTRADNNGAQVTLPAMPDGFVWDIQATAIDSTSTATNVVVLY